MVFCLFYIVKPTTKLNGPTHIILQTRWYRSPMERVTEGGLKGRKTAFKKLINQVICFELTIDGAGRLLNYNNSRNGK